jgi:hypothetical protein
MHLIKIFAINIEIINEKIKKLKNLVINIFFNQFLCCLIETGFLKSLSVNGVPSICKYFVKVSELSLLALYNC